MKNMNMMVTAMLVGRLSDIYGRKVFILTGIGIFMTGAFLCGTANSIFGRVGVVAAFFIKEIPLCTSNRDETDEAVRGESESRKDGAENYEEGTENHEDSTENKEKHGSEAAVTYK